MEEKALRVLVVDDNPADSRLVQEILSDVGGISVAGRRRMEHGLARVLGTRRRGEDEGRIEISGLDPNAKKAERARRRRRGDRANLGGHSQRPGGAGLD